MTLETHNPLTYLTDALVEHSLCMHLFALRGYIQKFLDWQPGARTANDSLPLDAVVLLFYESV